MTGRVTDEVESAWVEHRKRLFDLAYRMLGSVSDADDVVQETYLRLARTGLDAIDDVTGWLVAVAGRVCLDRLRSAAVTRSAYVGPWLPEPLVAVAGTAPPPEDRVTLDETVRMALLVVLDRLTPAERTSFVLHDVFGVPFDQVAEVVGRSPAACRQLASRARRRIASDPAAVPGRATHRDLDRVAHRFAAACRTGRVEDLVAVLDPGARGDFDSGGAIAGAPLGLVEGAEAIARQLAAAFAGSGASFEVLPVNGEPGVVAGVGGRVVAVMALASDGHRVVELHAVGNPAKLAHLTR